MDDVSSIGLTGQRPDSGQKGWHFRHVLCRPAIFLWSHRWLGLTIGVILSLVAWEIVRLLLGPLVEVEVVKRSDLVQSVVASGHVETPFRVQIGAQITGTVAQVLVQEGVRVVEGQPLIEIVSDELKAAVVEAKGELTQADATVRQLSDLTLPAARDNLRQSQATLAEAQVTFDRTSALARNGIAPRSALDDAERALDIARSQVDAARLQVYAASPGGSDYVLAQTRQDQARANLDLAKSRLAYATVLSPRDGRLIARSVERGSVVEPGLPLLVLAPDGPTQLVVDIDERNLGRIRPGQEALASADAYPDDRFSAVLSYVNPGVDISRASVEVKLDVPEPPAYLLQDMTVSVDVEVARRDATLVVPIASVHDAGSDKPWVLVARGGKAVRQPVRLGLRGLSQVEVLEGVSEGEAVVAQTEQLRPGQRLRPKVP